MNVERSHIADIAVIGETEDLTPGVVQVESVSMWIGANHDVWSCFEDGRETRMRRFGTFTLADFALKHTDLFLQFALRTLQRAILRLDLREHLIEGIRQNADFIAANFVCTNGIIFFDLRRCAQSRQAQGSGW